MARSFRFPGADHNGVVISRQVMSGKANFDLRQPPRRRGDQGERGEAACPLRELTRGRMFERRDGPKAVSQ